MLEISNATQPAQKDQVRGLMQAFVAWHRQRHAEFLPLVDRYFDAGAFADELAHLPGKYAPPRGRLLLALSGGQPAGCVALRQIDAGTCEMKRMFVYPGYQGQGVGRALAQTVIAEAQAIGYTRMLLDTGPKQVEAQRLYQSLGFQRIEPYYPLPPELQSWLVFMALDLAAPGVGHHPAQPDHARS